MHEALKILNGLSEIFEYFSSTNCGSLLAVADPADEQLFHENKMYSNL